MAAIKVLGINDDTDTCECCGRTGLKRVVWLERDESGPFAAGVDCAGKILRMSATRVHNAAVEADRKRKQDEENKIHEIGEVRSVRPWVVESVSSQGECSKICFANGLRSVIEKWAEEKFPTKHIHVRLAN